MISGDMKVGQICKVVGNNSHSSLKVGEHIMHIFEGYVCLERPDATWTGSGGRNFSVKPLKDGTTLTYREPT